MKRKMVAGFLAVVMSFSFTITTLAADIPQTQEETEMETETEKVFSEDQKTDETDDTGDMTVSANEGTEVQETDGAQAAGIAETDDTATQPEADVQSEEGQDTQMRNVQDDTWTAEDFVYGEMEQTLNGCDYTRQFVIKGRVVSGLSESGQEKLKTNKNLVLPDRDDKGETLVGVGDGAFKDMGLASVTFPEGMMVDYDDTVTHVVTKRGNFIVGTEAFAKNNLTDVYLPEGVIAIMPSAFKNNQIENVTIPHTVWWIENSSFAYNNLSTVGFPKTCDFQLQIHAFAFAHNAIKYVRLPDYTEVVEKKAFYWNPGMEACPSDAPEDEQTFGGVVWMYTDNPNLANMERIHHIDRTAESQHSWHQRLVIGSAPADEDEWTVNDFTYDGTVITGLSESGTIKRKLNKELVLPDQNPQGQYITKLADTSEMYGLFATEEEGFTSVDFPINLEVIGDKAFANNGLETVVNFPPTLKEIGLAAFQNNRLTSVILPDSVTTVEGGAFATNPTLEKIILSKGLTEIASGAFGCSTAEDYMVNLTELDIPEGITKIGQNAFAGNNIKNIVIPSTVKEIGNYAFSTKNYLKDLCTLTLPEGLETIGSRAFRNKVIEEVQLPTTVKALKANTFEKEYSDETIAVKTKVYVSKEQYADDKNFPDSSYHEFYIRVDESDTTWDAYDFTYAKWEPETGDAGEVTFYPAHETEKQVVLSPYYITGFSELGKAKLEKNPDIVIPSADPQGNPVTGIGPKAFYKMGIESVTFPEEVMTGYEGPEDIIAEGVKERGNFVIMSNAFYGNNLKSVILPDGVIGVGVNAFKGNKSLSHVTIPHTMWRISAGAFADCQITTVEFPKDCDFKLNIDKQAFAINQIKAVQLPKRVEKVDLYAFMNNTGMEPVDASAPSVWKKSGVVYLYADPAAANESFVDHLENTGTHKSWAQKLITDQEMPEEMKPWNVKDFTFDGTEITGLSDSGKKKITLSTDLVMPDETPAGEPVTSLADTTATYGLFGADGVAFNTVVLPEHLETIGNNAFAMNGIAAVTFPETLKRIGTSAFRQNNLVSVILPDSVTEVGTGAFASNFTVAHVKLSKGMTEIPAGMFSCSGQIAAENFTEIIIPEGITKIGANAFAGNHFSRVEIPEGVTVIDSSAFAQTQDVRALTEIILPEGLEEIGRWAFRYTLATEIELPSTVKVLHKDAFRDNGGVVTLYTSNKEQLEDHDDFVANSNYHKTVYNNLIGTGWSYGDFIIEGNVLKGWSEQGNQTRRKIMSADTETSRKILVLPEINPGTGEAITEIADGAFKIPDEEVEQLKDSVNSPNGMDEVRIPSTVTKIGEKAFEYNNFKNVDFPEGLITLGVHAFHGNKLETVLLPESATDLKEGVFAENNITSIRLPDSLKVIPQGLFSMNIRLEQIEIPDTVTEIGDMAFAGARLTSLSIPESVVKIGRKAFHLHHLSELTIPGNVKEIGESAFEGTFKAITLKKLVLEEGIETIGSYAFKEGYLETVELPDSLTSLGKDAFYGNSGTNNDHIVKLYTSNPAHMNWEMDETCQKLVFQAEWSTECFTYEGTTVTGFSDKGLQVLVYAKEVVIPDKTAEGEYVTAIADNAFKNLGIEKITLPSKLVMIGENAFTGNKITEVMLPETVSSVAENAFDGNVVIRTGEETEEKPEIDADQEEVNGTQHTNTQDAAKSMTDREKAAKTGDAAPLLPAGAAAVAALAVTVLILKKKKQL